MFEHIVSATCEGEHCHCGRPATHKVGEEFAFDNKQDRHNFTAYLCCSCFGDLFGEAARRFCRQGFDPTVE